MTTNMIISLYIKKSRIQETPNLSTDVDSITNIFVSAGVRKGADRNFFWGGGRLPVVMMYIFVFTFFQGTDATVLLDASCNDVHFCLYIFLKVLMPLCSPMPVVMMYIFVCTFFKVPMPRCSPGTTKFAWEGDQHTDRLRDS